MINIRHKTIELATTKADIPADAVQALFDIGLLEEHVCRKVLIREEYAERCAVRNKTNLKITLAEKYCVSLSTVEKYLQGDRLKITDFGLTGERSPGVKSI